MCIRDSRNPAFPEIEVQILEGDALRLCIFQSLQRLLHPVSYTHLDVYKRQNVFRADITLLLSSGLFGRTEDLRAGC